jgi:O-antigen/teichoic acid export membrane protein
LQVFAFGAGFVLGALLLKRVLPRRASLERPEHAMGEWVRSAIPLLLLSVVQGLNTQMEVILLGAIKGSTEAGLLTVASRAAGVVAFVLVAVGYPISPLVARLHASGQNDLLRRTVRRTALTVFLASVPIAVGAIAFAHPLLRLFGGEFAGGGTALILLVLGQLAFAATGLSGTVLVMTGHESWLLRGAVVGAVANVVLNAALIPPFGLNGAAAGTAIALTAMNICMAYFARRRAGVPSTALGF